MTWGDGSEVLGPQEDVQKCKNDSAGDDRWAESREDQRDSVS